MSTNVTYATYANTEYVIENVVYVFLKKQNT